jgi:hypothetical protein
MAWSLSCFATTSIILKGWRYRYVCRFLSHIAVSGKPPCPAQGRLVRAPAALVLMWRMKEAAQNESSHRQIGMPVLSATTNLSLSSTPCRLISKVNRSNFCSPYDLYDPFAERLAYSQAEG